MPRAFLTTLCLAVLLPISIGRAQDPASANQARVAIFTLDLVGLECRPDFDAVKQAPRAFGTRHQYGLADRFGAPARLILEGRFDALEAMTFQVLDARPVKDVKVEIEGGRLLELRVAGAVSVTPRYPLIELDLRAAFGQVDERVKAASRKDLLQEAARFPELRMDLTMADARLRTDLSQALKILAIRRLEKILALREILSPDAAQRGAKLGLETEPKRVEELADALSEKVRDQLWWRLRINYNFVFGHLGNGPEDRPEAAFIPGALAQGVGRITVKADVEKGRKRILWFRFPAYQDGDETIEVVKLPKSWLWRLFKPGPAMAGALLFVEVADQEEGDLELVWARNDATGAAVLVQRPAPLPNPY